MSERTSASIPVRIGAVLLAAVNGLAAAWLVSVVAGLDTESGGYSVVRYEPGPSNWLDTSVDAATLGGSAPSSGIYLDEGSSLRRIVVEGDALEIQMGDEYEPSSIVTQVLGHNPDLAGLHAVAFSRGSDESMTVLACGDSACRVVRTGVGAVTTLGPPLDACTAGNPGLAVAGDTVLVSDSSADCSVVLLEGAWARLPPKPDPQLYGPTIAADGTVFLQRYRQTLGGPEVVLLGVFAVVALIVVVFVLRAPRPGQRLMTTLLASFIGIVLVVLAVIASFLLGGGAHGRPVRRAGRRVRARPLGVQRGVRLPRSLSALARGIAWARDAAEEHASIEAFEKLAADLARLGAPRGLIERTRHAACEEVGHRDACIAIASRLTGLRFELPPDETAGDRSVPTPTSLAVESLLDGSIGEGNAARRALAQAARASGLERRVLVRIAREEATHAALADDIVAFARVLDPIGVDAALRSLPKRTTSAAR